MSHLLTARDEIDKAYLSGEVELVELQDVTEALDRLIAYVGAKPRDDAQETRVLPGVLH